jgi:hypothetical protein
LLGETRNRFSTLQASLDKMFEKMKSKAYHAFQMKMNYFDDDIELIDVLREGVKNDELTDPGSKYVLRRVDPARHAHLSRRQNSPGSREVVINHLRSTIYSSYVKDMYEELTHYLRSILEQASKNGFNAGRLIGEHSFKVDARTILELGSWDRVCRMVAESVFQFLESEKSTLKLLEKMATKLALGVDGNLITTALPYLEIRHFLVHADGRVSAEYMALHPHIFVKDDYVVLNYAFINGLRTSVRALIADFDKEIIGGNILRAEDTQP